MNRQIYINGMASLSAQSDIDVFHQTPQAFKEAIFYAPRVNYKEHINPMLLRRMSKAVKMGLFTAKLALLEAGVEVPDGIIVGTGEGCKQDTEKFLQNIMEEKESLLTPTAFIQSTHNTVGGQIALVLRCIGYNMTYSQNSASFESTLADALLMFSEESDMRCLLIGGVDEIATTSTSFYYLDGQLKSNHTNNLDLLSSTTSGTITSEGSNFFLLSKFRTPQTYAQIVDSSIIHRLNKEKLNDEVEHFLFKNNMGIDDVDIVVLGNNGDSRFDTFYRLLQEGLFADIPQIAYKHIVGEYNTVTAYACWLSARILKEKIIPDVLQINRKPIKRFKNLLIYNQYLGKNHSLTLLRSL